ncbi:MAG: carboxypeptidase-like regulatory domain-containing protein, partial [bacterium]|nr:carboxypeptidase-like regulatory domain-containing protein [bacterium]
MKVTKLLTISFVFVSNLIFCQNYSGYVLDKKTGNPIKYVNIGIVNKNIGTVSDFNGKFKLFVDSKFNKDFLKFSCIGYHSNSIRISDLEEQKHNNIELTPKIIELKKIVVHPKSYKKRTVGLRKTDGTRSGFSNNSLGWETGIIVKFKKKSFLEKVKLNIAECSFDTIFFRLNIYKTIGKLNFENILDTPIYFKVPKNKATGKFSIDLNSYNLVLQGDYLITIENVKNLGEGKLYFYTGKDKCYYKNISQGRWGSSDKGICISVDVKTEK